MAFEPVDMLAQLSKNARKTTAPSPLRAFSVSAYESNVSVYGSTVSAYDAIIHPPLMSIATEK
jgi:hypothetical protein